MKKIYLIPLIVLLNSALKAQLNLVPNCDFESFDTCPDYGGQIERCTGWKIFSSNFTTPDYYNSCDTSGLFAPPYALFAHQSPHSGNAYSAIITFWPNEYREYIGIQLLQPLVVGQLYFVSFYTCMGELNANGSASNKLGARFSTVQYDILHPWPTNNWAHLYSDTILTDSVNWRLLSWNFIADSSYQYLTIGNFFINNNTDTVKNFINSAGCYYLIDDVCVTTDSLQCQCTNVGIPNLGIEESFFIQNPVSNNFNVLFSTNEDLSLSIFDILGREIFHDNFLSVKKIDISLDFASHGLYIVSVYFKRSKKLLFKKILKL